MKKFSIHRNKWDEVRFLMKRYKNPYTVLGFNENFVSVITPLSKTEMHIVCDLAACRLEQKEKGQDPDYLPLLPFSLVASERYKAKYADGVTCYKLSEQDYERLEAAGF